MLDVTNPLQTTRRLMLHFGASAADMRPATLEVLTPRGTQRFNLASSTPPTLELNVPPGKTRLALHRPRGARHSQRPRGRLRDRHPLVGGTVGCREVAGLATFTRPSTRA
jgi:hypothetical protein